MGSSSRRSKSRVIALGNILSGRSKGLTRLDDDLCALCTCECACVFKEAFFPERVFAVAVRCVRLVVAHGVRVGA